MNAINFILIDENYRPPKPNTTRAVKFLNLADAMQSAIDNKMADRLTNTAKRQQQASYARLDGEHLQRTQEALRALAARPDALPGLASKKAVHDLTRSEQNHGCGYYSPSICTGKPYHNTPDALELWQLLTGKTEEEKQAEALQGMINNLMFSKIPGYFATPSALRAELFELADVQPGHRFLEPQAGSGGIADDAKALGAIVDCCEVWFALRDILKAKGHNLIGHDFLDTEIKPIYDRIVMNPPFEKLQDIAHIQKAFKCLKDGGLLVSIMSNGPFFRRDSKCQAFREWFEEMNGYKLDVPAGAFKESGTNVASIIIVLEKPHIESKSDLTRHGEQYVIPGADKEQTIAQGSLWG